MALHPGTAKPAAWLAPASRYKAQPEAASLEAALRRAAVINAALLKLSAIDLSEMDTEAYRACIDTAIAGLEAARSAGAVRMVEQRLADDAHRHLRAQEALLHSREEEFSETVALLTDAVIRFRDTNTEFTSTVLDRSDRMGRIVAIEDLRTLRAQLESEIGALRHVVLDKQQADAQQIAALSARVELLETRLAVTASQANRDALTGLANRAAWDQRMDELALRLDSGDLAFALAMIDVDQFKRINDTHGHSAGDAALVECAELCRQAFGMDDFVARYGGDEIAVLMAAPSPEHAVDHVRRLIESIHRANTAGGASERAPFTISVGLAMARNGDSVPSLLNRADKSLYAAKQDGRDRLVVSAG